VEDTPLLFDFKPQNSPEEELGLCTRLALAVMGRSEKEGTFFLRHESLREYQNLVVGGGRR